MLPASIAVASVFGFVVVLFFTFWLIERDTSLGFRVKKKTANIYLAVVSGSLLFAGLGLLGIALYHTHNDAAKKATLANVSTWAYNKYGIKLDAGQAGHLVEKTHNLNYPSDVPTWDLGELAVTGNVAYLGKTDVVLRGDKTAVVKAQLMKLDSEWYLVDANHAGPDAELKRR